MAEHSISDNEANKQDLRRWEEMKKLLLGWRWKKQNSNSYPFYHLRASASICG
jgi:hypothetical protein